MSELTAGDLIELFNDPEGWKEWYCSLSEERRQLLEDIIAEFKQARDGEKGAS